MEKVQIIVTRKFYGCKTTKSKLLDNDGNVWDGTMDEAIKLINKLDNSTYYLSHNEACRPSYSITYNILYY